MTRLSSILATLILSVLGTSANAIIIDFTDAAWRDAVQPDNTRQTATVNGVTVTAAPRGSFLTFNSSSSERAGCAAGQAIHGLACIGDGIGIRDDEVSQSGVQQLTIGFDGLVDILGIDVLDLFGNERDGETALMMLSGGITQSTRPPSGNLGVPGGYWHTPFSAMGVSSITLLAPNDGFSDFALARIEYRVSVPEPGTLSLIGAGLLGLALLRRRRTLA